MRSSPSRVSVTALTLSINGVFALDPGFLYGGGGGAYIAVPLSILLSLLISIIETLYIDLSQDLTEIQVECVL